ncbi:glycosyltransferase family A protein [Prevotella sp. P3-122]|uniref:glycosyltransferase family 2 protein n=1 Tax=Prevotella sp. P3-122 TaxID=2024223 RepID=UPI001F0A9D8E|nr:glycosyltransferase family A protein [Prevotella sp. P3-122]
MVEFSVIMPTYNQKGFIRNAIRSLFAQTYKHWELIIVDDGCTDGTKDFICDYLQDNRITYIRNKKNEGIGYAINRGLDIARYNYITYLPSDDYYYENHLQTLKEKFELSNDNVLVYTTMNSKVKDSLLQKENIAINGLCFNHSLQMVQTAHKRTTDRWIERSEWVSEDLYKTFWHKLINKGNFVYSSEITCQWTIHPNQRHRIICENFGGHVNKYRCFYNVKTPIKIKISDSKFYDEEKIFENFRRKCTPQKKGLKILLVGELSYNPERIYAFEEAGNVLYGLWVKKPLFAFSNIGPLPFGHIQDLDKDNWKKQIREIKPDIIYALTNFCAVKLAHEVLMECKDIPFVWHFKEGPFLCIEHGIFEKLIDLYTKSDGQIYLNKEAQKWYEQFIPKSKFPFILDGDLPKDDYFTNDFSKKLSDEDGEIHTVVAGRLIGITIEEIGCLAKNGIHIHLYNESYEGAKSEFFRQAMIVAPNHFHIHKHCSPNNWTEELSKYDIGWLHCFDSENQGYYDKVRWNDINIPARLSTMMAAGIPTIQKDNSKHIVAMFSYVKERRCGIFYTDIEDLICKLKDTENIRRLQENVLKHRMESSFDYHMQDLIDYFRKIIKIKNDGEYNT